MENLSEDDKKIIRSIIKAIEISEAGEKI